MDTDITELEELGAEKVSGVGSPANGTPWLLLKGQDVVANPESPHTESPEANEQEEEMTKAEADDIEAMLTKARFGGFCDTDDCGVCKERFGPLYEQIIEKSKLKTADRKKLPKSAFAIPAKAPASGSYPIHDESHARNALARSSGKPEEAKVRTAVTRRYPKMGNKSTGVPDVSTKVPNDPRPESQWHLETGQSGLAGPMTAGERQDHNDPSFAMGGEPSYVIPDEKKVTNNPPAPKPMDRPGRAEATSTYDLAGVTAKESWTIEVVEKENWVSTDKSAATSSKPGDSAWQAYDAASCDSVARGLAEAKLAIEAIRTRELTEAVAGDASEWFDAYQLNCAAEDICSALALVASLAYREAADGKSQSMSDTATKSLQSTQSLLTSIVGQARTNQSAGFGVQTSEEESIMATVTKEELDAQIAESASKAAKKAIKQYKEAEAKKAKKKAKKLPAFMEKNANNGGDITHDEMESKVKGHADANDIGVIGHGVESQYRNAKKSKKNNKAMKSVESKLESVETLLAKMAGRPRAGGPVLDGQPRGAFPASEGRATESVTKGAGDEIQRLEKSMETVTDPMSRDQISRELTLARLRKGHEDGLI